MSLNISLPLDPEQERDKLNKLVDKQVTKQDEDEPNGGTIQH